MIDHVVSVNNIAPNPEFQRIRGQRQPDIFAAA